KGGGERRGGVLDLASAQAECARLAGDRGKRHAGRVPGLRRGGLDRPPPEVAANRVTAHRSSLVRLRVAERPHVHLFHAGGGGSHAYRALAEALPARWTVTASDDLGVADSIPGMAELYLEELVAEDGVPDVLGGWS